MKAMHHIYLVLVMAFAITTSAIAQTNTVEEAVNALQAGNIDGAVTIINKCVKDPAQNTTWEAWYYKGFIYKDLSKKQTGETAHNSRVEAFEALKKAIQLDPKKENFDQDSLTINYIASKFNNEANNLLTDNTYDRAIESFDYYKQCIKVIDPNNKQIKGRELLFKAALGSVFVGIYEKDSKREDAFNQAAEQYLQIIKVDSANANANIQLAKNYYNKGVAIINNLNPDDIMGIDAAQEKSAIEFRKSLPYAKRAYRNEKRKDIVEILRNIYSALNETELTQKFSLEYDQFK
jgi:hypothetical protein